VGICTINKQALKGRRNEVHRGSIEIGYFKVISFLMNLVKIAGCLFAKAVRLT
jgi:hypothetical protein